MLGSWSMAALPSPWILPWAATRRPSSMLHGGIAHVEGELDVRVFVSEEAECHAHSSGARPANGLARSS